MTQELIGQIIGIIATVITAISYQTNTKKTLLFIQTLATSATCISYLFLNASSGFLLNIVCIIRNLSFYFQKEGTKGIYASTSVFMLLMAILGAFSWQGPISLLIIFALITNTFFLSLGKPQILKYSILLTSAMILIYNIYVFTIGGILNESISIISAAIGILRFRQKKQTTEIISAESKSYENKNS